MIEKDFYSQINKIFLTKLPEKIAVAVSGGLDSMALVFLLKESFKNLDITALIVDHKFRNNSTDEARKVSRILEENQIKNYILTADQEISEANIENNLRETRYGLLNKFCLENKIEYLFVGHHKQDIAENFLIRLFRGSGIDGLASLDYVTEFKDIKITRPLLDFKKEDLRKYLEKKDIQWVEDETNKQDKYLRNKIRNFLESLDDKDLINNRVSLASKSILNNKKIVEKYLKEKLPDILSFNEVGYFLLNIKNFCELSEEEARKYLSLSLMEVSGNHYKPRLNKLENLYEWILSDKEHKARSFYGCIVEKYDNKHLIIYREKAAISEEGEVWDNRFRIQINQDYEITTLDAREFNELKVDYNIRKEVIYTLPVFKKDKKILAIPHLNYYSDNVKEIGIKFDKKTILTK